MLAQRIRPLISFAYVGTWIVAMAAAINLLLGSLDKTPVLQWLPDRQTGIGFLMESKQRIDAAQLAYRSGVVRPDHYLGVIVGISDVREGVSIEELTRKLGDRWRFIGVAGAGAGSPSIAEQAELVSQSQLRPDLVVLGISPMHMLDTLVDPARSRAIADQGPPPGFAERSKAAVREAMWVANRRHDLRAFFDRVLMDVRSTVQSFIGLDAATQDSRSPWRPMLRTLIQNNPTEKTLSNGIAWARSFGADRMEAFQQSVLGPGVAGGLVRDFTRQGACVMVIIMPEHSRLRALMPAGVGAWTESRLRQESGVPNLAVLDFRDRAPDNDFIDLVHLNTEGSTRLSGMLADSVRELGFAQPPLMGSKNAGSDSGQRCAPIATDRN